MGILNEINAQSVISELKARGLSSDEIERAMQKMVGPDWRETSAVVWYKRLQEKNLIDHNDQESFLDDLEALVKGRTMLDDLYKRGHRWGKA